MTHSRPFASHIIMQCDGDALHCRRLWPLLNECGVALMFAISRFSFMLVILLNAFRLRRSCLHTRTRVLRKS